MFYGDLSVLQVGIFIASGFKAPSFFGTSGSRYAAYEHDFKFDFITVVF
jgi:hypothetical protein